MFDESCVCTLKNAQDLSNGSLLVRFRVLPEEPLTLEEILMNQRIPALLKSEHLGSSASDVQLR